MKEFMSVQIKSGANSIALIKERNFRIL